LSVVRFQVSGARDPLFAPVGEASSANIHASTEDDD
jgi:hypothetical protein